MKKFLLIISFAAMALTACSGGAAPTDVLFPTLSPTPNPCTPTNAPGTAKQFANLMREFDDTSYVASFTSKDQLVEPILKLQDVRRRVQAIDAPPCMKDLRKFQIDYMNGVINALAHFLGGAKGEQVQAEIAATRSLRLQYEQEFAKVLGVTYVPPPTTTPRPTQPSATPAPTNSPAQPTPTSTPTAASPTVTVVERANLRAGPGTDFELIATLNSGETAAAIGRTEEDDWIQVEFPAAPNGKAWLLARLVSVSVPVEQLPVATP